LDRLEDKLFSLWQKSRAQYGKIKAAQSNAMLGTRIHPRASI